MREIKQPGEGQVFAYDFTTKLAGQTIASITSVVSDPRGSGANMTQTAPAISGNEVKVLWVGGADGETYATTVKILDSAGQTHEIDGEIKVVNLGFTLPEGITSTYITAEEYVARYGLDETVRLTDAYGSETVGEALGNALSDAAARIEGYIAARYGLPLVAIPPVLKVIAADLARERLFTNHPTDEVTRRADQARKDLQDIAKGVLELVGAAGVLVEETAADEACIYAPAQVFTDDVLNSYRGRLQ